MNEQVEDTGPILTPAQQQENVEKEAFIRYAQDQGKTIPSNYEDAGVWFDALKNAQGQYTQGQQEIAELKRQYNENGGANPNFTGEDTPQDVSSQEEESVVQDVETLKISDSSEESIEDASTPSMEPPTEVSVGEWNDWGNIIDASNGVVPAELRSAIKTRLNVDDKIIDDYMQQRQSTQQHNVDNAATLVGGKAELNKIMAWAGKNLNEDERGAVNGQLAGPGYKTAILGLRARYETSDNVSVARGREPNATLNRSTSGNTVPTVTCYASNQEMFADQRNPRYKTDGKFRQAVDSRIIATRQRGFRV